MRARLFLAAMSLFMSTGLASPAAAQCLTRPAAVAPKLNGTAAYGLAQTEAAKWKPDHVLIRMMTTMAGPLDAQGRSSQWTIQFFSPSAKQLDIVSFGAGKMTCSTVDAPTGGDPVTVTAETIFDTARLYALAQQAGGSAHDATKVAVMAGLSANGAESTWSIDYTSPQGRPMLTVTIDSTSGKVTSRNPN